LPSIGSRLDLGDGGHFKAATLDRDLTITTGGLVVIVSDRLSNMCQGCIGGVNNYDLWMSNAGS
jgi:hypothetical protein